jgi:hypothetical protein
MWDILLAQLRRVGPLKATCEDARWNAWEVPRADRLAGYLGRYERMEVGGKVGKVESTASSARSTTSEVLSKHGLVVCRRCLSLKRGENRESSSGVLEKKLLSHTHSPSRRCSESVGCIGMQ